MQHLVSIRGEEHVAEEEVPKGWKHWLPSSVTDQQQNLKIATSCMRNLVSGQSRALLFLPG